MLGDNMEDKIMYGKPCAIKIKEYIKKEIENIKDVLKLVVIWIGDDEASSIYIKNKQKVCEEVGIELETIHYENIEEKELINKIKELNNDMTVTGILIQLPISDKFNTEEIINKINPLKDVDGITDCNLGSNLKGNKGIFSCTAFGIMKLLDYYKVDIEGKNVVIINRSVLVGKPLVGLLLRKNATVTICHSKTVNLKEYTKKADILVVAVGKPHFIKKDMIKKNSVIIDVGISRMNNKIVGDVNLEDVIDKCKLITPVPKGVGVMTTTMLAYNVLECYKMQKEVTNER